MTPSGKRNFRTAAAARASAKGDPNVTSFAVIKHPRQTEYAWVAPVEVYLERTATATHAGIQLVEMSQ